MSDLILPRNTAKVETENLKPTDEKVEQHKHWIKRAGQALERPGMNYVGSAVVHYFGDKNGAPTFQFQAATVGMGHVPEPMADAGLKTLRKVLMGLFGRKPL